MTRVFRPRTDNTTTDLAKILNPVEDLSLLADQDSPQANLLDSIVEDQAEDVEEAP